MSSNEGQPLAQHLAHNKRSWVGPIVIEVGALEDEGRIVR